LVLPNNTGKLIQVESMKIAFARLDKIEKIFKEGAKKATNKDALEIWENTIGKMFEATMGEDLFALWKLISSDQKQIVTSDTWHSFQKFKILISKEQFD